MASVVVCYQSQLVYKWNDNFSQDPRKTALDKIWVNMGGFNTFTAVFDSEIIDIIKFVKHCLNSTTDTELNWLKSLQQQGISELGFYGDLTIVG